MQKAREPRKRQRYGNAPVLAPLIQVMPEHRARIDPTAVPDLCCFLYAVRARFDTVARQTWSRREEPERSRRKAQALWARQMVKACDALMRALFETVDLRLIDEARREWAATLADAPEAGD